LKQKEKLNEIMSLENESFKAKKALRMNNSKNSSKTASLVDLQKYLKLKGKVEEKVNDINLKIDVDKPSTSNPFQTIQVIVSKYC